MAWPRIFLSLCEQPGRSGFFYHRPECVQVLVNFADPNLLWEPPVPKSARTSDMSARQGALMLGSMSSIWLDAGLVTTGVSTRANHEHPKMSLVGMASQRGFVAVMEVRMRRRDGMWHVDVIRCMSMLSVACQCCLLQADVVCCMSMLSVACRCFLLSVAHCMLSTRVRGEKHGGPGSNQRKRPCRC